MQKNTRITVEAPTTCLPMSSATSQRCRRMVVRKNAWWRGWPSSSPVYGSRWRRSPRRSEEHTSELQSLMRISYAVCCLKKKIHIQQQHKHHKRYLHQVSIQTHATT